MPWTNQQITLIILTEEVTGFSGLFAYSPAPGPGNLLFSLAAAAGTDPHGNAYPRGVNFYASGRPVIELRPDLSAILIYQAV